MSIHPPANLSFATSGNGYVAVPIPASEQTLSKEKSSTYLCMHLESSRRLNSLKVACVSYLDDELPCSDMQPRGWKGVPMKP